MPPLNYMEDKMTITRSELLQGLWTLNESPSFVKASITGPYLRDFIAQHFTAVDTLAGDMEVYNALCSLRERIRKEVTGEGCDELVVRIVHIANDIYKPPLEALNIHNLYHILSLLQPTELLALPSTSKFLNAIVNDDWLWRKFLGDQQALLPLKFEVIIKIRRFVSSDRENVIPQGLTGDKKVVLRKFQISKSGAALEHAAPHLQDDLQVVGNALQYDGMNLRWASPRLKNNPDCVKLALKQNSGAAQFIGPELSKDKVFFQNSLLCFHPSIILHADPEVRYDKAVALIAAKNWYYEMEWANDVLRTDDDFITTALAVNPSRLSKVPEKYRNDRELIKALVQKRSVLQYAHTDFRDDEEIAALAADYTDYALNVISDRLKRNEVFMLARIAKNYSSFKYADAILMGDRTFVLKAVKISGKVIKSLPDGSPYRIDEEIVLEAVKQDLENLNYPPAGLRDVDGFRELIHLQKNRYQLNATQIDSLKSKYIAQIEVRLQAKKTANSANG